MSALKNTRHEKFAQGLASGKAASEAYADAGFKPNTGNAATLKAQESISKRVDEILKREQTIEAKATERAIEKLAISKERVLAELAKIGFANMADYVDVTGIAPTWALKDVPRDMMAAISSMTSETLSKDGKPAVIKVKLTFWDKKSALVDIGKHLGMFKDTLEVSGGQVIRIGKEFDKV